METLLHLGLTERQLRVVIARRQQPFRIVAAILNAHVFGWADIPIQPCKSWGPGRFQVRDRLTIRFRYRDFDFVARKLLHPYRKDRALRWILAAIYSFAVRIDESGL